MTSKLKCPVCDSELILDFMGENYSCDNPNCAMYDVSMMRKRWETLIQLREKLDDYKHNYSVKAEQHERGYAYATKTIKGLQSKLEIATKAMNQVMSMGAKNNICYHLKAKTVKSILGNALEQIEHKEK